MTLNEDWQLVDSWTLGWISTKIDCGLSGGFSFCFIFVSLLLPLKEVEFLCQKQFWFSSFWSIPLFHFWIFYHTISYVGLPGAWLGWESYFVTQIENKMRAAGFRLNGKSWFKPNLQCGSAKKPTEITALVLVKWYFLDRFLMKQWCS